MLIIVDPHSGVPVYRQLVDQVRFQIASGMLRAGSELSSTRALSAELGVNPMTVSKAFVILEQEGLVERRPGLPLIVRAIPDDTVEQERIARLRTVLEPAVLAARQLELQPKEAEKLFRQMLEESHREVEA